MLIKIHNEAEIKLVQKPDEREKSVKIIKIRDKQAKCQI